MFRSLFGSKDDRPGPPKNQIEVVCPACSAAQYEPRLVVSTFCKKCGVHLSIHRKKVTASSVTRSGMGMPDPWADAAKKPTPPPAKPTVPSPAKAHPASAIKPISPPAPSVAEPPTTPAVSQEEAAEGGFGVFLMQQTAPAASSSNLSAPPPAEEEPAPESSVESAEAPSREEPEASAQEDSAPESEATPDTESVDAGEDTAPESAPVEPVAKASSVIQQIAASAAEKSAEEVSSPPQERRAHSNAPAPTAAPVPMTASTLQKMKNEGLYRNQYFKDAECFECDHKFKVSRSTRSTQCPNCEAMICLEDVEVNMPSTESIKTRGDVLIRKRGQVSAESIICKDLRCQGTLEANVRASGDAIFRSTGTMHGQVHCRRFIVEKGADVTFEHEIYADEVEVYARVTGSIFCNGCLLIGANGCVNGDVTTRSVSIEPGGELNGAMNIVRTPRNQPPAPPKE